ncbi:MAG: hypothetical protein GWN84_10245 [Gammaproteobacteria bacterium]|nr:hypothetical protein [Gammaproteobacteria bacterium]NIR83247.1 hypothetical protein [Gammaproteobacteria bacterium]NIR91051.1 hypothetical protein [Gammaproteobacteria bacterium]NIU04412.1 hypothetical protein [Gammaproteobacteria bacterium]NIV76367.1 hypothetical protein [Gammaproteobacteria bacterium]
MIDIKVSEDFAAARVAVALGCVQCVVTVTERDEALDQALAAEVTRWETLLADMPVAEVPPIAAARRAYKALGKDPSRYRVSSEALLRRIGQGKGLYRINSVVDTNNLVSLCSGYSVGSYRAETLTPPVVFRKGTAGESYQAIGRGALNLENLPIFADAQGPFGSPTSDSERSMITADTEAVLMVIIAFGEAPDLEEHLAFAAQCLESYSAARDPETAAITP